MSSSDDDLFVILGENDWKYSDKPARLEAWSDRRTAAVLERLVKLPNVYPNELEGASPHVEAIYRSAVKAELAVLSPKAEEEPRS